MQRSWCLTLTLAALLVLAACGGPASEPKPAEPEITFPPIDGNSMLAHTRVLASDEYQGRLPGTKGEELTVAYLTDQLK